MQNHHDFATSSFGLFIKGKVLLNQNGGPFLEGNDKGGRIKSQREKREKNREKREMNSWLNRETKLRNPIKIWRKKGEKCKFIQAKD